MSLSRIFTIIGDQNIRRNMTGLNMASREVMQRAQVLDCVSMSTFDSALQSVRPESNVLIIATITEFIMCQGDCGTIYSSIDPVLATFVAAVKGYCAFRPDIQVLKLFSELELSSVSRAVGNF